MHSCPGPSSLLGSLLLPWRVPTPFTFVLLLFQENPNTNTHFFTHSMHILLLSLSYSHPLFLNLYPLQRYLEPSPQPPPPSQRDVRPDENLLEHKTNKTSPEDLYFVCPPSFSCLPLRFLFSALRHRCLPWKLWGLAQVKAATAPEPPSSSSPSVLNSKSIWPVSSSSPSPDLLPQVLAPWLGGRTPAGRHLLRALHLQTSSSRIPKMCPSLSREWKPGARG